MAARVNTVLNQEHGERWSSYHGDCVALATEVPDNSVDFSAYSPPFSNLYVYSESEADMGNTDDDAHFLEQYRFLVREKLRATRPGRLSAVHIKDQVYYMGSSERGTSGIRPLSDMVARVHMEEGWDLQCRVTIWRDPVMEQRKTDAHGLLYKSFRTRADICRVGMPEYLLVFRKWSRNEAETALERQVTHDRASTPLPIWQELASPVWPASAAVWNYNGPIGVTVGADGVARADTSKGRSGGGDFDLPATDTLNVKQSRDPNAERHICPLPLNITARAIGLWSNKEDSVWSPFSGIGSEGVMALRMGRRFFGSELNPVYWQYGVGHLRAASSEGRQMDMFDVVA